MKKKIIDRLNGLPFLLIGLIVFGKYLELFFSKLGSWSHTGLGSD